MCHDLDLDIEFQNEIVKGVHDIATHLKYLGTGDNGSQMGAIEFLAVEIKEAGEDIASGLRAIAEAIERVEL